MIILAVLLTSYGQLSEQNYSNNNFVVDPDNLPNFTDKNPNTKNNLNFTRYSGSEIGITESSQINDLSSFEYTKGKLGLYATDYNNDSWTDILVTGEEIVLWENIGGKFKKSGAMPNIDLENRRSPYAHFLDNDNDQQDELILITKNHEILYYDLKNGKYKRNEKILDGVYLENPTAASSGDLTGNGCLDLIIGQYGEDSPYGGNQFEVLKKNLSKRPDLYGGEKTRLFFGNCNGFREASDKLENLEKDWTFATSIVDVNNDNRPDIHIANDFSHDVLYINKQNGFNRHDMGRKTDRNAMSSEITDLNNDGLPDIMVSNIYYNKSPKNLSYRDFPKEAFLSPRPFGNNALINQGDGSFIDKGSEYGINVGGTSWAMSAGDYNNDHRIDIVAATSAYNYKPYKEKELTSNQLFMGTEDNFTRVSPSEIGFYPDQERAVIHTDFDKDGDLDLISTSRGQEGEKDNRVNVYENNLNNENSISFILNHKNKLTTNARLTLKTSEGELHKFATSQSDLSSQEEDIFTFGLGNSNPEKLKAEYIDGTEPTLSNISKGRQYTVQENKIVDSLKYKRNK